LPCRPGGTQIAPEDVSGIRHHGERLRFCRRRSLTENWRSFLSFSRRAAAARPTSEAFYSLLLERASASTLPAGTWVVAAGNASRTAPGPALSSALVNRVIILQVRVDVGEWLAWAHGQNIRPEILTSSRSGSRALQRPSRQAVPFSTPRAWASLAQALDRVEAADRLSRRAAALALAVGRVSLADAEAYCLQFGKNAGAPGAGLPACRVIRGIDALEGPRRSLLPAPLLTSEQPPAPPPEQPRAQTASRLFVLQNSGVRENPSRRPRRRRTARPAAGRPLALEELGYPADWVTGTGPEVRLQLRIPARSPSRLSQAKALIKRWRPSKACCRPAPGVGKTAS